MSIVPSSTVQVVVSWGLSSAGAVSHSYSRSLIRVVPSDWLPAFSRSSEYWVNVRDVESSPVGGTRRGMVSGGIGLRCRARCGGVPVQSGHPQVVLPD